jgi:hypothetical protein
MRDLDTRALASTVAGLCICIPKPTGRQHLTADMSFWFATVGLLDKAAKYQGTARGLVATTHALMLQKK